MWSEAGRGEKGILNLYVTVYLGSIWLHFKGEMSIPWTIYDGVARFHFIRTNEFFWNWRQQKFFIKNFQKSRNSKNLLHCFSYRLIYVFQAKKRD